MIFIVFQIISTTLYSSINSSRRLCVPLFRINSGLHGRRTGGEEAFERI